MTAVVHTRLVCDICGCTLHDQVQRLGNQPMQELLPWLQQPPTRFVYQYLGRIYDFCDACAEPIAAGIKKALESERAVAHHEAAEAAPPGVTKQ